MPGEWKQELSQQKLFYLPRTVTGEDMMRAEVIAPPLSQLVVLEGSPSTGQLVHDIEFRGLTFRHSAWRLPPGGFADSQAAEAADSAFKAMGAVRITIADCTFNALGGYSIHFQKGSSQNAIVGDTFGVDPWAETTE